MSRALAAAPAMLRWARTEVDAELDVLALLAVEPVHARFYWEQVEAGVAVAAVGAAAVVRTAGTARLAAARARLVELERMLGPGGLVVGGFAFDAAHRPGGAWRGYPGCEWTVPRLALVRRTGRAHLIACTTDGEHPEAILAAARARLVRAARPWPSVERVESAARRPSRYAVMPAGPGAAWRAAVGATLVDIERGRLEKLVLARASRLRADAPLDPLRTLTRLRDAHPRCTVFAVGRGDATFVGASPERLARVSGRTLETGALAGTAPRGSEGVASDRVLARELRDSPKERREHAIVVHDVRQRLGAVCERVRVAAAPRVVAHQSVQHLHTPISARLREGGHLLDVVATLHPTAAVCGLPREAAAEAVAHREPVPRGWYTGGVGWLDGGGGELTVALRTALLRGPRALLHAGAGIVAGSRWEAELEETRLKMRPLLAALLEL
jgi:isochorismate synthase